METATLGQIGKIINWLDGVPRHTVQERMGAICASIRGTLTPEEVAEAEIKKVSSVWDAIVKVCDCSDITFTVPHKPQERGFQVRCWKGEHGRAQVDIGHIDKGTAKGQMLFETWMPERLEKFCTCCLKFQLQKIGIMVYGGEWVMETREGYDILIHKKP